MSNYNLDMGSCGVHDISDTPNDHEHCTECGNYQEYLNAVIFDEEETAEICDKCYKSLETDPDYTVDGENIYYKEHYL
jgi:hypothetical protein